MIQATTDKQTATKAFRCFDWSGNRERSLGATVTERRELRILTESTEGYHLLIQERAEDAQRIYALHSGYVKQIID